MGAFSAEKFAISDALHGAKSPCFSDVKRQFEK
jgi:hypothetical protein